MALNKNRIYGRKSDGYIINPFNLSFDLMDKLVIINFENDHDEIYRVFEPQCFNDDITGIGMLVIGYRLDGKIDVYHEETLDISKKDFDAVEKGLNNIYKTKFKSARFVLTKTGIDIFVVFKDLKNREVVIKIKENAKKKIKPFSLLAPLGYGIENPVSLPLVYLHDFYFIRKKNTELTLKIGDKNHLIDKFPVLIDFSKMHFIRYSLNPFTVNFNKNFDGGLKKIKYKNDDVIKNNNVTVKLLNNNGYGEIEKLSVSSVDFTVDILKIL